MQVHVWRVMQSEKMIDKTDRLVKIDLQNELSGSVVSVLNSQKII